MAQATVHQWEQWLAIVMNTTEMTMAERWVATWGERKARTRDSQLEVQLGRKTDA